MRGRSLVAATLATTLSVLSLSVEGANPPAALRVLVSNSVRAAVKELQPTCERAIGRPLAFRFDSTSAFQKKIDAGERFDAAILTSDAVGDLVARGRLAAGSRADLGRSELVVGIRAGAPTPDIRTPEALRQTLLNGGSMPLTSPITVPTITYPSHGDSRPHVEEMFQRIGIGAYLDDVDRPKLSDLLGPRYTIGAKVRIILAQSPRDLTTNVATGKATLLIALFSEMLPNDDVEIIGGLPGPFRYAVGFAAAASPVSKDREAAQALIACLAGPEAAPIFRAKGLG